MRKNVNKVVEAFKENKSCFGSTVWTDGATIYSYGMPIVRRRGNTYCVILKGPSKTTSGHANACATLLGGNVVRCEQV